MQHKFLITLTFSDPIDTRDLGEIENNIAAALKDWVDTEGLAPEESEAYTEKIEVVEMTVQAAKDVLSENGYIGVYWCEKDIRAFDLSRFGKDIEPLTEDEIHDIACGIEEGFDASIGVSWDTISDHIWEVLDNRKNN